MKLLLLAGYKPVPAEFWLRPIGGVPLLESRIRVAAALARTPMVVLAGESADAILRSCPALEKCELIFDTNGANANLLTNLRAGLRAADEPMVVWPAEIELPLPRHVQFLQSIALQRGLQVPYHVVQAICDGELVNAGLPFLLTPEGRKLVLNTSELKDLTEPRVKYEYAHFRAEDELA